MGSSPSFINTTMIQMLANDKVLENITIYMNTEYKNMIENLQNPMFPKAKEISLLASLIETCPFGQAAYDILKQKFGETEEIKQIVEYFTLK